MKTDLSYISRPEYLCELPISSDYNDIRNTQVLQEVFEGTASIIGSRVNTTRINNSFLESEESETIETYIGYIINAFTVSPLLSINTNAPYKIYIEDI